MPTTFRLGEWLVGQAAVEQQADPASPPRPPATLRVASGLGEAAPVNVIVMPVLFEEQVLGVIELASFNRFTEVHLAFLDQIDGDDRRRASTRSSANMPSTEEPARLRVAAS